MVQVGWRREKGGAVKLNRSAGVVEVKARKPGKHLRHRLKLLSGHVILTLSLDRRERFLHPILAIRGFTDALLRSGAWDVYQVRVAISRDELSKNKCMRPDDVVASALSKRVCRDQALAPSCIGECALSALYTPSDKGADDPRKAGEFGPKAQD
jgi:hypothetical protein